MVRQRVVFLGRVQGVGFRAKAQGIAARLGITGWVRNEPDGRVLMEAQGDPDPLAQLHREIDRELPRFVIERRVQTLATIDGEGGFEIRR